MRDVVQSDVALERRPVPMSTQEQFVQQFTRFFEHYTHALTSDPQHVSKSAPSASSDDDNRLVAAARLAILELETNAKMERNSRKYFAKPGEAEWGC
jgi:hypothetical protein